MIGGWYALASLVDSKRQLQNATRGLDMVEELDPMERMRRRYNLREGQAGAAAGGAGGGRRGGAAPAPAAADVPSLEAELEALSKKLDIKSWDYVPVPRTEDDGSTGARLGGTVGSNNIKSGDKLYVYQLDPEELCTLALTDQFGYTQDYVAWVEDELSYWVDEFLGAIRAGGPGSKRGGGRAPVAVPAGGEEVVTLYDMEGGGRPVSYSGGALVEDVADDHREAGLLVFRQLRSAEQVAAEAHPRRLQVATWLWNGIHQRISALRCTPLWQVAHAAVLLSHGPRAFPFLAGCSSARSGSAAAAAAVASATPDDQKLVLIRSLHLEFDMTRPELAAVTVGDLRRLQRGLDGSGADSSDDEEEDEEDEGDEGDDEEEGGGGTSPRVQLDLDLMCSLNHGGALQLAAMRGTLGPGHPGLAALPGGAAAAVVFSRNAVGPLFLAAARGHLGAVEALLAWGADPLAGN
ncbi:hypothetical protein HYH02_001000, partial [Chlamydomonas schloesseri]